tara:strand:+ start:4006 stop:4323 length:318 start_codon:yes stop_codon:yes gene_type:complete
MYVNLLESGDLLRPLASYCWEVGPVRIDPAQPGAGELIENGILHHAMVYKTGSLAWGTRSESPAVYVKTVQLSEYYGGVMKQHCVLINGMMCAVDGYQFQNVEKI